MEGHQKDSFGIILRSKSLVDLCSIVISGGVIWIETIAATVA